MFDSNFTDFLKNKIVLSDVIGRDIEIIKKGHTKTALCPFHKEKTPSFHINDEKGFYYCFGCGARGDVITYTMKRESLTFLDAIKKLAEEYHIELPKTQKSINKDNYKIIYDINEKTCQFFEQNIINSKIAINYIKNRGLNIEHIKKFRIGYAPKDFDALIDYLSLLGFKKEDMEKAGVIALNKNYYDKFRNRIMFPVLDKLGKVIAFTGRVINKEDAPKYMNSPETPIYHKSSVLFNYFFAKNKIYEEKTAFLVEGNLDALSMSINGIENVVAPMGTAITIEQIEELWKIADNIIVCLDGDNAGQKASLRLANLVLPILKTNKNISFVSLPNNTDPDDFVRNEGKNYFIEYINNNLLSLSEFLWNNEIKNIDTTKYINAESKTRIETNLKNITKNIKNSTVAKNFNDFFKGKMFFLSKYKKDFDYKTITKINYSKHYTNMELLKNNIINIEKNILSVIISDFSLIDKIFQLYNIDIFNIDFVSTESNELIAIFLKIYENKEEKDLLIKILEKNGFNYYINNSNKYKHINNKENILYALILERNINSLEIEIKNLSSDNNNEEKRKILMLELESLQKKREKIEEYL